MLIVGIILIMYHKSYSKFIRKIYSKVFINLDQKAVEFISICIAIGVIMMGLIGIIMRVVS